MHGQTALRRPSRQYVAPHNAALALTGGLAVGIGASAIFTILLIGIAVHQRFPSFVAPDWVFVPTIVGVSFVPAACFALLVAAARHEPAVWSRILIVGASLPLAGVGGLLFAVRLEPLGLSQPELMLPVFRLAFISASGLVAFVCTLIACWTFRVPGSAWRALEVAAMTAIAYALLALALDPIPGFHVGGGDRAMPKVAALCNLVAGLIGGANAFTALTARQRRGELSDHA
jgi:hypothetical protein